MALDTDTLSQFLDALDRFVKERLIPYEDRVADEDVIPVSYTHLTLPTNREV